jgi:hypothetical protein
MYMFQSLKSFKIKALCTKSETLKRLCPIELINCSLFCHENIYTLLRRDLTFRRLAISEKLPNLISITISFSIV